MVKGILFRLCLKESEGISAPATPKVGNNITVNLFILYRPTWDQKFSKASFLNKRQ
jgi:hypothetical protein